MATNRFIRQGVVSEQELYESIVIESIAWAGQDVYFLPRTVVEFDDVLNESTRSSFNGAYPIEMYPEDVDGFGGEGDLFAKFGIEVRDTLNLVVSRRRWEELKRSPNSTITSARPLEGDVIYFPMVDALFEIKFVEHEQPFYQLKNLPVYKLSCELLEITPDIEFNTGLEAVDSVEREYKPYVTVDATLTNGLTNFSVGDAFSSSHGTSPTITVTAEIFAISNLGGSPAVYRIRLGNVHSNSSTGYSALREGDDATAGDGAFTILNVFTVTDSPDLTGLDDNVIFENEGDDIIDWSEKNPFGDPSESN